MLDGTPAREANPGRLTRKIHERKNLLDVELNRGELLPRPKLQGGRVSESHLRVTEPLELVGCSDRTGHVESCGFRRKVRGVWQRCCKQTLVPPFRPTQILPSRFGLLFYSIIHGV